MLKNPRFTALALLMLTMAIGAGTLVFRVLTLHPRTNSVDLDSLQKRLRAAEIPSLHSVLVIQDDQMIVEWYFEGADEDRGRGWLGTVKFGPGTLHDVRSITKSIVSLLFGIAMADGAIRSLDSLVLEYFPEYKDLQTPERRKIRLRDLLTMTSGLRWDEWSYPYGDIHNGETAMDAARDRYEYILSLPIDSPPCMEWRYSGGDAALIAAVVAAQAVKHRRIFPVPWLKSCTHTIFMAASTAAWTRSPSSWRVQQRLMLINSPVGMR